MQQQVSINQNLLEQATQMLGANSPTIAVEEALKTMIRLKQQAKVKDYFGKLAWDGDLETMRLDNLDLGKANS